MLINGFNSYFELFATINLGYGSIAYIKNQIIQNIYGLRGGTKYSEFLLIRSRINELSEKYERSEDERLKQISENIKALDAEIKGVERIIKLKEKGERKFVNTLEPISIITAFFCIALIIIGGIQEMLIKTNNESILLVIDEMLMLLSCIVGVLCYTIFCGSFSTHIVVNNIKFSKPITLLFFLIFLLVSCYFCFNPVEKIYIARELTSVLLIPIIFYITYTYLTIKNSDSSEGFSIKFSNIFDGKYSPLFLVIFIVALIILLIPILSYFSLMPLIFTVKCKLLLLQFNTNLKLLNIKQIILHAIIFTIPINLYIFITIRSIFHNIKFRKKYDRIRKDYQSELNGILKVINTK